MKIGFIQWTRESLMRTRVRGGGQHNLLLKTATCRMILARTHLAHYRCIPIQCCLSEVTLCMPMVVFIHRSSVVSWTRSCPRVPIAGLPGCLSVRRVVAAASLWCGVQCPPHPPRHIALCPRGRSRGAEVGRGQRGHHRPPHRHLR